MKAHLPARWLRRVIRSRPTEVDTVCLEIRAFMAASGLTVRSFAVELIARECLNNAVLHGNQQHADKNVRLELHWGRRWLRLQIADEGAGFNWRTARGRPAEASAVSGRGRAIAKLYADRVAFNRRGNQITLWLDKNKTLTKN